MSSAEWSVSCFALPPPDRNQEDVEIPVAVAGKRNPFPVGRETSVNVSRAVDRQALHVLTVFVSGPDVAQIAEDDAAVVIMRIANQPRFAAERRNCGAKKQCCCEESGIVFFMAPDLRL